ncbi:BtpA/SgcQ family protein [Bacillus sp. B-jedd]|uniref:BtpA/SgcQ family protein n=1 Tax=Bacillus sp. B-jedd TaxID=1476857 RepID=UPI0005156EE3|nr:BtpA/SgcQ family protein [Bacillus sp. B-jedd]CEG26376.1 BtpA family protein [Bacillus sp. B-jedd]
MSVKGKFMDLFGGNKPIMGMLHLKGNDEGSMLDIAKKEIDLLLDNGVNAVIVENYFGSVEDVATVLDYLQREKVNIVYGVNVLDHDELAFEFANKYGAKFIQLDSVAGHLEPEKDAEFHDKITKWRNESSAFVMGGVRFKYQPYKSGRSLEEDLEIGMSRCDALVVTGDGTGMQTPIEKINEFRKMVKDFPLIIGAGMTPENCAEQLKVADGAIVGSYFKDTYTDKGNVDASHVQFFMRAVEGCR